MKTITKSISAHFEMERDIVASFNHDEEVFIRNPAELRRKILSIRSDGKEKLNIFSDFDSTLTKKVYNNSPAEHSFNAMEKEEIVGKDFVENCARLRAKYLPLEIDPSISKKQKEEYMDEWWKATQSEILKLKPTKNMRAVSKSHLYFRNGCIELLRTLIDNGLKLHVVSAGVKAVVSESFYILQMQKELVLDDALIYCMTPEIYDQHQENALIGFGEPTVTSTNKHLCINHERYPEIQEGTNAILMGDLVEDLLIVKNLKMKEVIGIGFLNVPAEYDKEALDKFMSAYDIVISNDGNMIHVVELLKNLIGIPIDEDYAIDNEKGRKLAELLK